MYLADFGQRFGYGTGCLGGQLQPPSGGVDGPGWALANQQGTNSNINFAITAPLSNKGSFPYPSSNHGTGVNAGFCDGSVRFLSTTIDGTVYAKILTPAGSKLPHSQAVSSPGSDLDQ